MIAVRTAAPILLGMTLSLAGCVSIPDTYAPPIPRRPITGFASNAFGSLIDMNDSGAQAHIVRDIRPSPQANAWLWTMKRPELQFALSRTKSVRLIMDFAVPRKTFEKTGPVTLSFFVNDKLLDTVRYDQPGFKHYEKAVPPDWLRAGSLNTMAAEIDKLSVSPQDGTQLGFILGRAGFAE